MSKEGTKSDPILGALKIYGVAYQGYSRARAAMRNYPPELAREPQAAVGRLSLGGDRGHEPILAHSRAEIDAFFDKHLDFLRALSFITPANRLATNVQRAKAHQALEEDWEDLKRQREESGYARADGKFLNARIALAHAERGLFKTRPTTLAGMRKAITVAERRINGGDWERPRISAFLKGLVR